MCIISDIILSSLLLSYTSSGLLILFQRSKTWLMDTMNPYIFKVHCSCDKYSDSISRNVHNPDISCVPRTMIPEISDQSYWITDSRYDIRFLVKDKGVIAVDAYHKSLE